MNDKKLLDILSKQLDITERIVMSLAFDAEIKRAKEEAIRYCENLCIMPNKSMWETYKETDIYSIIKGE